MQNCDQKISPAEYRKVHGLSILFDATRQSYKRSIITRAKCGIKILHFHKRDFVEFDFHSVSLIIKPLCAIKNRKKQHPSNFARIYSLIKTLYVLTSLVVTLINDSLSCTEIYQRGNNKADKIQTSVVEGWVARHEAPFQN